MPAQGTVKLIYYLLFWFDLIRMSAGFAISGTHRFMLEFADTGGVIAGIIIPMVIGKRTWFATIRTYMLRRIYIRIIIRLIGHLMSSLNVIGKPVQRIYLSAFRTCIFDFHFHRYPSKLY